METKTPIRLAVILAALLSQSPVFARPPAPRPMAAPAQPLPWSALWHDRLAHDWDAVRGRPGPLQQALGAVRKDLRIAHDERFIADRPSGEDEYLQRAAAALRGINRELASQWADPMYAARLAYVTQTVWGMADGRRMQTPALYQRLDQELAHLQQWRWAP